ncbi:MAG: right-handed parallel beta-helix repeat-containing protein [Dehalococcoidia bacterium]
MAITLPDLSDADDTGNYGERINAIFTALLTSGLDTLNFPVQDQGGQVANARAYARVGDGTLGSLGTGTLRDLTDVGFASLAAAQAVFPAVTALTQSFDSVVLQHTQNLLGTAGGGRMILGGGPGTFMLGESFIPRQHVITEGDGTGFYPWDGSTKGTILSKNFNGDLVTPELGHGWQLRDLTLFGNKDNYTGKGLVVEGTGDGLGTNRPRYWRLRDVVIFGNAGVGLYVEKAGQHWLTRVESRENDGHGIQLIDCSDWHWSDLSVGANGESAEADADGANLGTNTLGRMVGCKFWQNFRNVASSSAVYAAGCTFEKGRRWGVYLGGNVSHVVGSTFVRNGTDHTTYAISGGLHIDNRTYNTVTGNVFHDADLNMRYCVYESGAGADHNVIEANTFKDFQTAAISWVGPNTRVQNNPGFLAPGDVLRVTATPESAITAPPGVEAFDVTNGKKYIKLTGTGNTGWSEVAFV